MFLGSQTKTSYQLLQISVVSIFWVRKKKGTNRCKIFLASFGLMPVDPEAGATSSKLTCQCITPLCNAMILKILRCVDWWLTHGCLLDVDLLANKMPTKVCVSAQLCMRPHVVHRTSRERKRDIWFVWKEIAFWNLWCILCAFHCSRSQSWWGTLPNKEECAALVQVQSCLFFYCNPKDVNN